MRRRMLRQHTPKGSQDTTDLPIDLPYGTAPQGPENYPIPPEKRSKNKKSYSGSVLIAGMVAAALVGGVTAAGTTYVMNDDAGSSSVTNSTSQGVVINNPDSVTEVTAAAAKASPSVVTL